MVCQKCGSQNISVQTFQENLGSTTVGGIVGGGKVSKSHGLLYWLFIGWWWVPIKWICFAPIMIIKKIKHKGVGVAKTINKTNYNTICTCQNCGNSWKA